MVKQSLANKKTLAGETPTAAKPLVLLVDDDASFIELVAIILGETFDFAAAGDGAEALRLFRRWEPDIVITDIVMPRLDGFVLISELRKHTDKPIVAVSGGITKSCLAALSERGADEFIAKPDIYLSLLTKAQALVDGYRRKVPVRSTTLAPRRLS